MGSCVEENNTSPITGSYPCQLARLCAYPGCLKLGIGNNTVHCSLKGCFVVSFLFSLQHQTYRFREKGEPSNYMMYKSFSLVKCTNFPGYLVSVQLTCVRS